MKLKLFSSFLLLVATCLVMLSAVEASFAQTLDWAKQMGGTSSEVAYSMAIDASGNVFTTGAFKGTADFDPDPVGTFTLASASAGNNDIFISKLNSSGNFVWAKRMGMSGSNDDQGNSITTDASGNVYTTGFFRGTVDFDPSPTGTFTLTSGGGHDIFISKLNASGDFVWAKAMSGTGNNEDQGYSIKYDGSGNIYTTGWFKSTVDFDPSPTGTFTLAASGAPADIFISKLDSAGNFIWAKAMGGTSTDEGYSIYFDPSGNVYTTGLFSGTVDFDPSNAGVFNITAAGGIAGSDLFISKLDSSGNFKWAKAMGSIDNVRGSSITIDSSGNVYTTGYFNGTVDFDPSVAGVANLTSSPGGTTPDIFIFKLDSAGNFKWAKAMGGTSDEYGNSIVTDTSGNVYITGSFKGTVDFDPDLVKNFNIISAGQDDIFISKLDSSGNFIWAKAMGGTLPERGNSIAITPSSNVYIAGFFQGTADFDPTPVGTYTLTSAGSNDIYVAKYNDYCWPQPIPICMVTVDDSSKYNIIIWDKTATGARVDSFIIYREITLNNFQPIGAVSYDSLSQFIDTVRTKYAPNTGDPNGNTYQYKIQVRDTCGNYSGLSPYHNTIYMTHAGGGTFTWAEHYKIEGAPNPAINYILMREDNNSGVWNPISSVSGTQQNVSDPNYAAVVGTADWRIYTDWNISCTPTLKTMAAVNNSKSNTFRTTPPVSVNEISLESSVSISPNPNNGEFKIQSLPATGSKLKVQGLEIYNVYGEKVHSEIIHDASHRIHCTLPSGIYFAHIKVEGYREIVKKVVITK